MKENKYVQKCITIKKEQEDFLKNERTFKLSLFVQTKLEDYIKLRREYKQFMTEDGKEEI